MDIPLLVEAEDWWITSDQRQMMSIRTASVAKSKQYKADMAPRPFNKQRY
jgi:hypothetical protein